jgi:predicted extracellular nuclease
LVQVNDVVVTAFHDEAARNDTAWVQDPRAGASNAGMKVFIRGVHSATRNARVDITGTVVDYFGETEINDATVVLRGGTGVITPVPLTSAQAADEMYEGMLVRLVDVSTINPSYSCSLDDAMCTDLRLWEVNGSGGILVYNFVYEDFDWDSRSASTGITGVMNWRYNRRRIMPRNGADFSP